jgi:hypothetical protein
MRQSRRHAATSLIAYTQRLRCAGAPRRPAGPSLLSRAVLSVHVADPTPAVRRALLLCTHTTIPGFLVLPIESPAATPSLPAIIDGLHQFRGCIVLFMLRPARLPSPPDWLRRDEVQLHFTTPSEDIVTPASGAVRCRTALGVRLNGRTGNLPSSGLSPDQSQQLVRLHSKRV